MHVEGSLEPMLLFALCEKNGITLDPVFFSTIPVLEERYRNFTSLGEC